MMRQLKQLFVAAVVGMFLMVGVGVSSAATAPAHSISQPEKVDKKKATKKATKKSTKKSAKKVDKKDVAPKQVIK
jgi:hypothetical protein